MKRNMRKKIKSLMTYILIACFMAIAFLVPQSLNAYADSVENQQEECSVLKRDSEQLITETREEYKNLYEYTYNSGVEALMEQTGMTVGESLVEQICYYQKMLGVATDEQEIDKINNLIVGTKNILDMYQSMAKQDEVEVFELNTINGPTIETVLTYAEVYALSSTAVPAAIAWFGASNYLLSAELLTHAWIENFFPGDYYPIHGNRVVGSQTTYDFIKSALTYNEVSYTIHDPNPLNTYTCYEEDLGFALNSVKMARSSVDSSEVRITDIYDFEVKDEYNEVLAALIGVFEVAQKFGIIGDYNVIIDVDVADALYLKLNSTSNGAHSVTAYNYSEQELRVAYNTKMCMPEDAQIFQGISDISFISIPANGSRTISIKENALATYITFCYVKDGYKVITYADELYLDRNILNTTFTKSVAAANDVAVITKVGSDWLINITNTYGLSMRVDYNSKMCNESDAKNWTGLKNIKAFYLDPGESELVYISENFFATHIAARFVNSNYEYYIYANNLNINGTMSVGRRTVKYIAS